MAMRAEQFETLVQTVRHSHGPHVVPEIGIVALGRVVMQDQEVAHPFELQVHPAVVFLDLNHAVMALGKQFEQFRDTFLDQVDAGGFERFEETA